MDMSRLFSCAACSILSVLTQWGATLVMKLKGGSGDVKDVVCCALLERLGARRASSSCPGRGRGGTPRGPCCHRPCHSLERSTGTRWLMARERRASGDAAAPRSRAAGAPATRRRRAVGGACARRARSNGPRRPLVVVVVVVVRTPTPNYLRQASPDRGKYTPHSLITLHLQQHYSPPSVPLLPDGFKASGAVRARAPIFEPSCGALHS